MKVNEKNFLQELRKHNPKSLIYIIDTYGGLVTAIIRKHLYLMQDKNEECFDDIFLGVWYNIGNFDETQNEFKSWIAAVARNRAIDYLRKYKRHLEEIRFEDECKQLLIEDKVRLLEEEITEETENMLSCLSKEDRDLLIRIYAYEEPMEQVVETTGINRNLIYKRVSRGKKKLRRLYKDEFEVIAENPRKADTI